MIGHFGIERTLKAMSLAGHRWRGMRSDVTQWIRECGVCQKINYQRDPNWEDEMEHHLYSVEPLKYVSVDTLGPLEKDKYGFNYIIVVVDNFSKLCNYIPHRRVCSGVDALGEYLWDAQVCEDRWRVPVPF